MGKKKYEDKLADELIKRHEEAEKYKALGNKAAGLASLLTKKPKEELLRKEAMKRLPVIFMKLCEMRELFIKKSPGMIVNLDKEIPLCEKYLTNIESSITVEKGNEILEWTDKITTKYGFKYF